MLKAFFVLAVVGLCGVHAQCSKSAQLEEGKPWSPLLPANPSRSSTQYEDLAAGSVSQPPAGFDCAIRQLTLERSLSLLPHMNATAGVAASLDLSPSGQCLSGRKFPSWENLANPVDDVIAQTPIDYVVNPAAASTVYVSPTGDDSNPGTEAAPFKTLHKAQSAARTLAKAGGVTVMLRGGTYYLNEEGGKLTFTSEDSGFSAANPTVYQAYPGETPVVAGGRKLDLTWKATQLPYGAWVVKPNSNNIDHAVAGPGTNSSTAQLLGLTQSAQDCQNLCAASSTCESFTWHDPSVNGFALMCYARLDTVWAPVPQGGHVSGKKPADVTVYVANLPSGTPANFSSLFINSRRQFRARWPDGSPYVPRDGYANPGKGECGAGCVRNVTSVTENTQLVDAMTGNVIANTAFNPTSKSLNLTVHTPTGPEYTGWGSRRPTCSFGSFNYGGRLDRYDTTNSLVYWANSIAPLQMYIDESDWTNNTWATPDTGVVHMFHPAGWGGWMYTIDDIVNTTIAFQAGGFQEARGGSGWGMYYVENIKEELNAPREWFVDAKTNELLVIPEAGTDIASALVETGELDRLIEVTGSQADPVKDVQFVGLTLTQTRPTFMDSHEVPSGGDWSIHRGGAVYVTGAERVTVSRTLFDQVDGNGIMFADYTMDCEVSYSEFSYVGDSCVLTVGSALLGDGRSGTQPTNTQVIGNYMHNWGVWTIQTAAFFEAISRSSNFTGNVAHGGPRAGINYNDGFYGGSTMYNNVIWNVVLQSGDHGNLNSWFRDVHVYADEEGQAQSVPITHDVSYNLLIRSSFLSTSANLYNLDHDDGSSNYYDHHNALIYGGVKFRDGLDKSARFNIVTFPSGDTPFANAPQVNGFETETFSNNTVYTMDGAVYGACASFKGAYNVDNNTFVTPGLSSLPFKFSCGVSVASLAEWQSHGYDLHSVQTSDATVDDIITSIRELLP